MDRFRFEGNAVVYFLLLSACRVAARAEVKLPSLLFRRLGASARHEGEHLGNRRPG